MERILTGVAGPGAEGNLSHRSGRSKSLWILTIEVVLDCKRIIKEEDLVAIRAEEEKAR